MFVRTTNITFERHKFLNRKQKLRKNLEQFWGILAEMAKRYDICSREEEGIRDILIINMKNYNIRKKLLTNTLSPMDAFNVALIDEMGMSNHLKTINNFKIPWNVVNNSNRRIFNVKRKPAFSIERGFLCIICGKNFTKGLLPVCLKPVRVFYYL